MKLPLKVFEYEARTCAGIVDADGNTVVEVIDDRAIAEEIVRRVNLFGDVADSLAKLYTLCPQGHLNDSAGMWAEARNVLAKSKDTAATGGA